MFVAIVINARLAKTLLDGYRSIFTKPIFLARTGPKLYYKFDLLRFTHFTKFYEFNTKMYMWIKCVPVSRIIYF